MKAMTSAALAACMLFVGCGGGADTAGQGADAVALTALGTAAGEQRANAPARRHALASSDGSTADLTTQLFALAETNYAVYFPSKQASRTFDGWAYRYYPETNIYLAVIGSGVFVLGGAFGSEAVRVGSIAELLGQSPTGKDQPLTASILGKCPDVTASTSPAFFKCMIGSLEGTQTVDAAKTCRLTVAEDGAVTLSSDGKSGTVGPDFGTASFIKNSGYGNFTIIVYGVGSSSAHLVITANPTISFTNGGSVTADFTPAGSATASMSCKLTVPK